MQQSTALQAVKELRSQTGSLILLELFRLSRLLAKPESHPALDP